MEDQTDLTASTAKTTPVKYEEPKYAKITLPLVFELPGSPLINRQARRRFEEFMLDQCKVMMRRITKNYTQLEPKS